MIPRNNIFKSALLLSAFFLINTLSFAQKDKLQLLPGSKLLEYDQRTGVYRLMGNVSFRYQSNTMFCDSAYFNENSNEVRAYGKVHINKQDTLNLFCDSLYYNGNTEKAKLWGNVRVRDREYKLTTDTLEYDAKRSQAHYHHGGRVESTVSKEVLTSKVGYFHPETKNFFFSKNVNYRSDDLSMKTDTLQYRYSSNTTYFYGPTNILTEDAEMYCESGWYDVNSGKGSLQKSASIARSSDFISGDTLLYNPNEGYSEGVGHVYYMDSVEKISFTADYAYNSDSLNYSFLTGDAVAQKNLKDDTLYIHADTLFNQKKDSSDVIRAYHRAAIYSSSFQCVSDSIVYNADSNLIELFYEPVVWAKDAELKGKHIDMIVNDSIIEKAIVTEKASILMEVESSLFYNQISGNEIIAYFKDNALNKAFVNGNAITIFYPVDEQKTDSTLTQKRMGMNRLYASNLTIYVDSNEVSRVSYIDKPDGVFYPINKIKKEEQFIPGFDWKIALRPKSREDLIKD